MLGQWIFNIFLYLAFVFNHAAYEEMVAAGAPCYGYIGDVQPNDPPPPCFYTEGE